MSNLTSVNNSKSELKNNSAAELSHAEEIPNQAELIFSSGDKSPSLIFRLRLLNCNNKSQINQYLKLKME